MSNSFEIKDPSKLSEVLRIFSALDDVRWQDAGNYNLINYCKDDLTADEKLLTHWLCYIADRQTAFQRVWDVGGYVLSHLVKDFTHHREVFVWSVLEEHMRIDREQGVLRMKCPLVGPNPRLKFYEIDADPVEFTSRYMPADLLSIYRTLFILDRLAGRSFSRFIYTVVSGETDQAAAVRKLAAALHFLTYTAIGNVRETSMHERMTALSADLEEDMNELLRDFHGFMAKLTNKFEPYGKKRLWCSIRDYLKSPEFNDFLVRALDQIDPHEATRWRCKNVPKAALAVMELPGDVWNNDPIFRDGLFSPHVGSIPKTWDMPQTIRAIQKGMSDQNATFYPEQLDVTFDFVPRMCGKLKCQLCIFGGGIDKLCHQQRGLFCPVTLAACGYYYPCNPDGCAFKSNSVHDYCQSSFAKKVV